MTAYKKTFSPQLTELPNVMQWVRKFTAETKLSSKQRKEIELAMEEAIVNLIHHADLKEQVTLSCSHIDGRHIEFVLIDRGGPFNPLLHETKVGMDASLQDRKIGGLGLMLMKKYTDALLYRREEGENILTLVKNIAQS